MKVSTILVIDDDPSIVEMIKIILELLEYRVISAGNGKEALSVLLTTQPDLILLDMKMPVMDGWEFAKEFRKIYADRIPVIVMTASADARKRAEEVSADDFVGKPFNIDDLLQKIRSNLEKARSRKTA